MKIFYFYTNDSDIISLKKRFEESVPSDFELCPQAATENSFCKKDRGGGYLGWINKYNTILKGFEQTSPNEYFIFSDIDVIFYKSFINNLDKIIKNEEDILFQKEYIDHEVNIGFMIIKNNDKSKLFWQKANKTIEDLVYLDSNGCQKIRHRRGDGSGQFVINDILYRDNPNIRWSTLPSSFWSKTIGNRYLNKDIYIHHANWTFSTDQKFNQMNEIKNKLNPTTTATALSFGGAAISQKEYEIIKDIIKKHNIKTVLEFGPGTSTQIFIEENCDILSIENNVDYINLYRKKFMLHKNLEIIFNDQNNIIVIKNQLKNKKFDLCFVDGPRADRDQYKMFNRIDSYILAKDYGKYILCHDSKRKKDRNSINLVFNTDEYFIEDLESERGLTLIYKK